MSEILTKGIKTRSKINAAIRSIEKAGKKLSISAVAKEAGISNSTIHNNYGDLAEKIRTKLGKNIRRTRDQKNQLLMSEREKSRELRQIITELNREISTLVSINAALTIELAELRVIQNSPNVVKFIKNT